MKICANKISKLILGSVIGEASNGGSRAKEEVGMSIQEKITKADKKWWSDIVNEEIFPKLIALGYPLDGKKFVFEKTKDILAELKVAEVIINNYEVDPQYIVDTFGVPATKTKAEGNLDFFV